MQRGVTIAILLAASSFLIWFTVWRKPTVPISTTDSIIVGTNAEYQPFTFIKNNRIVGIDIDIAAEICKRLDKKMALKDMSFTALIPALQTGTVQLVAAGMTPTPERAQRVLFTKPYLEGDELLIIALSKNPPINNVDELNNKKVIVNEGYVSDSFMSERKGALLQRLPNPAAGFLALKTGRGDAFVIARSSAQPFFEMHGQKEFSITPIEGSGNKYALAISKKYPELLTPVQETLDAMAQDGTLSQIKSKWGFK
ncbi:substrate-binding periplasmic protein [Candidatus Dependentiae bacterium]